MKLAAAHQPTSDAGCLQQRALRRKMGSQIPCNRDENVPALVASTPLTKLQRTRLQHLVGVKARILTQQRMRERRDQCLRRMIEDEMAGDKAGSGIDLMTAFLAPYYQPHGGSGSSAPKSSAGRLG
jgi:hypothetical protein